MDITTQCICINLRRAAQTVTQYYDTLLAPSGLNVIQFSLLYHIQMGEGAGISKLARESNLDRTTTGKYLRQMERDGLISLLAGKDLREKIAQITSKGEQALEAAYPIWQQAQASLAGVWGKEQLEKFRSLISELEEEEERVQED